MAKGTDRESAHGLLNWEPICWDTRETMKLNHIKTIRSDAMCRNAQTAASTWGSLVPRVELGHRATGKVVPESAVRQAATAPVRKQSAAGRADANTFESSLPLNSPLRAIAGIERVAHSRHLSRSAVLFSEGHAARGVYVLCSGSAKVSICSADGKKLIMRIARPGDVLGLYAGLTGRPFEATAEMLEPGRVTFVSRRDLVELIGRQEAFGLGLVQLFSEQFSEYVDHARLLLLSESATEKLARLILKWSRDFGELTAGGIRFQILLTQEEIAQIIGASRETVTRLFSALKREHIIGIRSGSMLIRNSAALASLAQE